MANTTSTASTTSATRLGEPIGTAETSPRDPLSQAGQEATESIGHLTERATDLGYRQADTRREQVANGLEELAGGMRRVSTDLEVQQPAVATIAQTAAEQTDRIARFLQDTDARQLVSNVEDLARRQPLLFLGGAFLLGMAASRLIKAGTGAGASESSYAADYRASGGYQATGPGRYGTDRGITEGL